MSLQYFGCMELRFGTVVLGIFLFMGYLFRCLNCLKILREEQDKDGNQYEPNFLISTKESLGSSFIGLLVNGFLIYGAWHNSRFFLIPWLAMTGFGFSVGTTYLVVYMFAQPNLSYLLLIFGFFWYLWFCVFSFYRSLAPSNPNHPIIVTTLNDGTNPYIQPVPPQPPPYDCPSAQHNAYQPSPDHSLRSQSPQYQMSPSPVRSTPFREPPPPYDFKDIKSHQPV